VSPDTGAGLVDLRRVTIVEYNNTVRDLLGDNSAPLSVSVIGGDQWDDSTFEVGGAIGDTDADALMTVSFKLATTAGQKLAQLMPGVPIPTDAAGQANWAQQFITTFGKRAYRRPVLPAEAADLFTLYQAQLAAPISAPDFPTAMTAVIAGMLMSPAFLYRWELGPEKPIVQSNLIRFNQYELASRLSYWLWASMPDDALLSAADAGQLATDDQIEQQIRRMLADPKAADGMLDFHIQWLKLTDLPTLTKTAASFTPDLISSMLGETQRFTMSVMGPQGDGKLQTLLTSPNSFVDGNLAKLYGVPNVTGTNFVPVKLDATQRAGILTQGSFLASRSNPDEQNPILVGVNILRRLFCMDIQKPTNIVVPPVTAAAPGTTIRSRYDIHGMNTCATQCHSLIDPPGFAFLTYDQTGAWMATDAGKPVDASGSFNLAGNTFTFKNAVDLVGELAQNQTVQDCMASMQLRYLNRRLEADGDTTSLSTSRKAFSAASDDVRELIVALAKTNAFTARLPNPGEQIQ
jgi:hypothetical protein